MNRHRLACGTVLLVVALAGCKQRAPTVTGDFSSAGAEIGTYSKTPDRCRSGGEWNYYGAAFFEKGSSDAVLELVQDPVRGWLVKVDMPSTKEMAILGDKDCTKLDVAISVERTRNNAAGYASGTAHFVCRSPSGSDVRGDLTFTNCN
jgi:hypothetical protein